MQIIDEDYVNSISKIIEEQAKYQKVMLLYDENVTLNEINEIYNAATEGFLMKELWKLFALFFKIGLFTFGGGYAMLPLLKAELVNKRRFVSEQELLDMYSIGQCTPGIIAINVATFIGYRQKGIRGAITTTAGMVMPSLIVIILLASVLQNFADNRYVAYAFSGIRICVAALIADVIFDLARKNIAGYMSVFVFIGALALLVGAGLSAVWIVIIAGTVSLAAGEIRRKKK